MMNLSRRGQASTRSPTMRGWFMVMYTVVDIRDDTAIRRSAGIRSRKDHPASVNVLHRPAKTHATHQSIVQPPLGKASPIRRDLSEDSAYDSDHTTPTCCMLLFHAEISALGAHPRWQVLRLAQRSSARLSPRLLDCTVTPLPSSICVTAALTHARRTRASARFPS